MFPYYGELLQTRKAFRIRQIYELGNRLYIFYYIISYAGCPLCVVGMLGLFRFAGNPRWFDVICDLNIFGHVWKIESVDIEKFIIEYLKKFPNLNKLSQINLAFIIHVSFNFCNQRKTSTVNKTKLLIIISKMIFRNVNGVDNRLLSTCAFEIS